MGWIYINGERVHTSNIQQEQKIDYEYKTETTDKPYSHLETDEMFKQGYEVVLAGYNAGKHFITFRKPKK